MWDGIVAVPGSNVADTGGRYQDYAKGIWCGTYMYMYMYLKAYNATAALSAACNATDPGSRRLSTRQPTTSLRTTMNLSLLRCEG